MEQTEIDEDQLLDYYESLERCERSSDFISRFYDAFFATSDRIAEKFEGIDLQQQTRMLRTALFLAPSMGERHGRDREPLERAARLHGPSQLNIAPELYDLWLDTLVNTARSTDPEFDDKVEAAWRAILEPVIRMFRAAS